MRKLNCKFSIEILRTYQNAKWATTTKIELLSLSFDTFNDFACQHNNILLTGGRKRGEREKEIGDQHNFDELDTDGGLW